MTAVDTNILLDILVPDAPDAEASVAMFEKCQGDGSMIVSGIVYSELASQFPGQAELDAFLGDSRIQLVLPERRALLNAGLAWIKHLRNRRRSGVLCVACGAAPPAHCAKCRAKIVVRQHVIADFLIGAHAETHADRLLSRDRGFYAKYFPALDVVRGE